MDIMGKGLELGADIANLTAAFITEDEFIAKYGEAMLEVVRDNLVRRTQRFILDQMNQHGKTIEEVGNMPEFESLRSRRDLFCAAFL